MRAEACIREDRIAEGLTIIDEALQAAPFLPHVPLLHGDLLLASGSEPAAKAAYERALAAARGWGAHLTALQAAVRLSRMTSATDPPTRAARLGTLRDVVGTFDEDPEGPHLLEARAILEAG